MFLKWSTIKFPYIGEETDISTSDVPETLKQVTPKQSRWINKATGKIQTLLFWLQQRGGEDFNFYLEAVKAGVVAHDQLPVVLQRVDVAVGH